MESIDVVFAIVGALALFGLAYEALFKADPKVDWQIVSLKTLRDGIDGHKWVWTVAGTSGLAVSGETAASWLAKRRVSRYSRMVAYIEKQQVKYPDNLDGIAG